MSGGGSEMRASGLRGTVALLAFLALLVGAAMFGGCGLIGKSDRDDKAGDAAASSSSAAPAAPTSVPPAQPIPRGTATPTLPLPRMDKVQQSDATQVSGAALTVLFTYDTTTDTTSQDAALRAEPWMTAEYAAAQRDAVVVAAPGAQWSMWAAHQAYTVPALEPGREAAPEDSATEAFRQWIVRYTPAGRDGWQGQPTTAVVFVTLSRGTANDPWRVSDLLVRS
ncbi:MAG: hypothetical protein HOV68_00080 [Streptomycetaceae bacterium]|nr:hypothetical protein [Streptomycetaceae bacterium]